jgi:hypothetical protein
MLKSGYILHCALKQQTPMIHFQHDEEGVCLRASEVKPKLDKFLLAQLGDGSYERGIKNARKKNWLIGKGDHPALNYKLRIEAEEGSEPERSTDIKTAKDLVVQYGEIKKSKFNSKICRSYFGNMADMKRGMNQKESIFYQSEIQLRVFCFNDTLQTHILNHILGFFLMHNFGTRQNKGFGSFKIVSINDRICNYNIFSEMKKYFTAPFYKVEYSSAKPQKQLNDVADIYQLMKTGVNIGQDYFRAYIYKYMHDKNIGNEKAWMKKNDISPRVYKPGNENIGEDNKQDQASIDKHYYVRAVLGIGDKIRYINEVGNDGKPDFSKDTTTVTINNSDKKIERFPSPILFKIIDEYLIIIPFEPNPIIFDQQFTL